MECKGLRFFHYHLREVDSTNRYIRDEKANLADISSAADALVVTADYQSGGRGQRGNKWLSVSAENLLLSILVQPVFISVKNQFLLSQITALAVKRCLEGFGISCMLKWPNDVYVGRKKICGMLLELDYTGDSVEQAIIGVGINVNQTSFEQMERIPVSMRMLTGNMFQVSVVREAFLNEFSKYYELLRNGNHAAIRMEYKQSLMGYGVSHSYIDSSGEFTAVIKDVCDNGQLVLQHENGATAYYSFKEVELLL